MCCPCCWARCWMLQDMYRMEASSVFHVKVGRFDQFEQSKNRILTVISLEIVMPTVQYDLMVNVWFMRDPGDVLRLISPDILSFEECPFYIYHTWHFSCCISRWIAANRQTTSDRPNANRGTVGIPCSYTQLDSAWIKCARWLSLIQFWLIATLYNLQDFLLLFVIIFLTLPQQQVMATKTDQPGEIGSESCRMTGAATNATPGETQ